MKYSYCFCCSMTFSMVSFPSSSITFVAALASIFFTLTQNNCEVFTRWYVVQILELDEELFYSNDKHSLSFRCIQLFSTQAREIRIFSILLATSTLYEKTLYHYFSPNQERREHQCTDWIRQQCWYSYAIWRNELVLFLKNPSNFLCVRYSDIPK